MTTLAAFLRERLLAEGAKADGLPTVRARGQEEELRHRIDRIEAVPDRPGSQKDRGKRNAGELAPRPKTDSEGFGADGGRQRFFFIHIPKTAGTSFRAMLYRQFDQSEIYPNQNDLEANNGLYPGFARVLALPEDRIRRTLLFNGHYPFAFGRLFGDNLCYLVFLRDPEERAVSYLHQLRREQPGFQGMELFRILDAMSDHITNTQVYLLAGHHVPPHLDHTDLDLAKEHLAACGFVGITEEFDRSVRLAEKIFQWRLGDPIELNVGPHGEREIVTTVLDKIREKNALDIELYRFGQELFRRSLDRYNIA
jgi:hypothetical protein